jgi:hypothetical protein
LLKLIIFSVLGLVAALLLTGCHATRFSVDTGAVPVASVTPGSTVTTSRVQISGDSHLGAVVIIGLMLAEGLRYFRMAPDGPRTPVVDEMGRALPPRVNMQDCAQPVDVRAGNLVCR